MHRRLLAIGFVLVRSRLVAAAAVAITFLVIVEGLVVVVVVVVIVIVIVIELVVVIVIVEIVVDAMSDRTKRESDVGGTEESVCTTNPARSIVAVVVSTFFASRDVSRHVRKAFDEVIELLLGHHAGSHVSLVGTLVEQPLGLANRHGGLVLDQRPTRVNAGSRPFEGVWRDVQLALWEVEGPWKYPRASPGSHARLYCRRWRGLRYAEGHAPFPHHPNTFRASHVMTVGAYDIRVINELVERESAFLERLFTEVHKVVVGQDDMVERVFMGLLCGGHVLLEGAPGLAKTLTVSSLASCLELAFKRVQFTPDLLPSDVLGTVIYNHSTGTFTNKQGPIFTNLLLADEINRAPAKVQSALLEAMAERHVTIGDHTYPLSHPFLVLATQNPIEQEGTYALPEAQLDRFMFKIRVGYPTRDQELAIVQRMGSALEGRTPAVEPIIGPEDLEQVRRSIDKIIVEPPVQRYMVDVVWATREPSAAGLSELQPFIDFGASPRASIALFQAARAHAFLRRRGYVSPEDVKAIAPDVLRHRIIPSYEAEAEGKSVEQIVRQILEHVQVP